jgi:D-sedoheptulose 7-phosphate isomerase
LEGIGTKLSEAIKKAKRTYIIGNGGSYANAIHIANDLLSVGVKAYTLDPATLTALANDHGYSTVFAKWLRVVGEPGDLLIALSGSGKSPNILDAISAAHGVGMETMLITQYLEGVDMQESEEAQISLGHAVMKELKEASEGKADRV